MNSITIGKLAKHTMRLGAVRITAEKEANSHASYHHIIVHWSHDSGTLEELYFVLKTLKSIKRDLSKGNPMTIDWVYDHPTQLDMGWDIARLLNLSFTFKKSESDDVV